MDELPREPDNPAELMRAVTATEKWSLVTVTLEQNGE